MSRLHQNRCVPTGMLAVAPVVPGKCDARMVRAFSRVVVRVKCGHANSSRLRWIRWVGFGLIVIGLMALFADNQSLARFGNT